MSYDNIPTLEDIDVTNKRVLFRIAADVPLTTASDGSISVADDTRLSAVIPTFKYLLDRNCSIVCCGGWIGRPNGYDATLTMDPVAKKLMELLGVNVKKLSDCVGEEVQQAVTQFRPGEIVLLENTRFHPEESANDAEFASSLASLAECCVFDAFAQSHRNHASTTGIVRLLPTVLGPQMVEELTQLQRVTRNPNRPFVVVLGGAKIVDKVAMLRSLVREADTILLGGAVATSFLQVQGMTVGISKTESVDINQSGITAKELVSQIIHEAGSKLCLPIDLVAGDNPTHPTKTVTVEVQQESIEPDMGFYDIGPKTVAMYEPYIQGAATVFWNGLMGVSETKTFSTGTSEIAALIAQNSNATIVGGGDTAEAVSALHLTDRYTHVSTGGGAALTVVSGEPLAVLQAMKKVDKATA